MTRLTNDHLHLLNSCRFPIHTTRTYCFLDCLGGWLDFYGNHLPKPNTAGSYPSECVGTTYIFGLFTDLSSVWTTSSDKDTEHPSDRSRSHDSIGIADSWVLLAGLFSLHHYNLLFIGLFRCGCFLDKGLHLTKIKNLLFYNLNYFLFFIFVCVVVFCVVVSRNYNVLFFGLFTGLTPLPTTTSGGGLGFHPSTTSNTSPSIVICRMFSTL